MTYYNLERSHRGYRLKARARPAQALCEALAIEELPSLELTTGQPVERETIAELETDP